MPIGIVQFFLPEKEYGFIRIPETREEIYVKKYNCVDSIQRGDRVSFTIIENKGGMEAVNVVLLDKKS